MSEGDDRSAKQVLEDVLTRAVVEKIWMVNYPDLIPFTLQSFEIGSVLPATLYMFRRGHRRGAGKFFETFAPRDGELKSKKAGTKKAEPSVTSVARVLVEESERFEGFESESARQVLADLLLCYCVENQKHEPGRYQPLIRPFPTHYMASWFDLPIRVTHLRDVPESLVAILASQDKGETVQSDDRQKSWFPVGSDFQDNILLRVLSPGMKLGHSHDDLHEPFLEDTAIGVDQLLTVRIAQKCGGAPEKLSQRSHRSKGSDIPNRHPVAKEAVRVFEADFRLLLLAYGSQVPRQSLIPMLESCIALGLTNIFLSTARMLLNWERSGTLPQQSVPCPMFVDASSGTDRDLRSLAEDSLDGAYRQLGRLPVILMALRIAEAIAPNLRQLKGELPPVRPDPSDRINMIGELLTERHEHGEKLLDRVFESIEGLLNNDSGLPATSGNDDAIAILENDSAIPNPVWRLAEAVTHLVGEKQQGEGWQKCFYSCLMVGASNGLAIERRTRFRTERNGKQSGVLRSIVLTNAMLDFLIHRYLRKNGKKERTVENTLSYSDFLKVLRENYGLYVDHAPPGQDISRELLLRNRRCLENRLRDLGLLVGVNDAESMKRLRPRFKASEGGVCHADDK